MTHEDNFNIKKWINENKVTNEIKVVAGGGPLAQFKQTIYKFIEDDYGVEERDEIKTIIEPLSKVMEIEGALENFIGDEYENLADAIAYTTDIYRTMIFGDNIH
jgi:pilus assembly protein TadC